MTSSPASKHRLYFLLQRSAHVLRKVSDAALKETVQLTTPQAAVLGLVAGRAPVSQKEIAGELRQKESAMTAMVARLEKLGYVSKQRSPADVRSWQLTPTKDGLNALKAGAPAFSKVNALLDVHFDAQAVAELAETLQSLINSNDKM